MKLVLVFALVMFSAGGVGAQCKEVPKSSPPQLNCVDQSSLVTGGLGEDWGKWYTLKTKSVPEGYTLSSLKFRLEGPHPCAADIPGPNKSTKKQNVPATTQTNPASDEKPSGISKTVEAILNSVIDIDKINVVDLKGAPSGVGSWSECYQSAKGPTFVEWKFRFQGWTEFHSYWNGNAGGPYDKPVAIEQRATIATVWIKASTP